MSTSKTESNADPQSVLMLITVVTSGGDEHECARLTATGVSSLVPCRLCWIALRDAADSHWRVVDQDGQSLQQMEVESIGSDLSVLADQVMGRGTSLCLNAEQGAEEVASLGLAEQGVQRLAVVPLMTLGEQLGLLIAGRQDGESFTVGEVDLFETLAQHLAVAIENFRLSASLESTNRNLHQLVDDRTKQLSQSEQRHRALLEINNVIIANLNRESLFAAVAESLVQVSPFDRASLVLHDAARDVLKVYGLAGTSSKQVAPVGTEFRREESHLKLVLEQRRPRIRSDLREGDRTDIEEGLLQQGVRSYVSVPLIAKSRVLGVLNLASHSVDQYSDNDAEFLLEAGSQVALAIENMLAYERIDELQQQLALENEYLREQDSSARGFGEIVGDSPALRQALQQVKLVAPTDANVIIYGESGTGKELIARAIHEHSNRRQGPLIRVNCAAIPHELFESEFFGHVKGAFTGAVADRAGRFELADRGTLFLDEVGEIPIDLQGKLLRVLQEGTFERVGEEQTRQVDVRLISATNRDLREEAGAGRFRQDLYYRLSVFPVELPPLRERRQDIPVLARHFARTASERFGRRNVILPDEGLRQLCNYDWPGNIRELQNVIERALITSRDGALRFEMLDSTSERGDKERTDAVAPVGNTVLTYDDLRVLERDNIERALTQAGWKIAGPEGAAELLGIKPTTLNSKLKNLGIRRRSRQTSD